MKKARRLGRRAVSGRDDRAFYWAFRSFCSSTAA
jgi:hypothetical protein